MIRKNSTGLYDALKDDILRGNFAPGSKLKIETLKARYRVGVNVIRESLARLATEDLVDQIDQKGFRVVQVSPSRLGDLTRLRILLETDGARHSLENGKIEWESDLVAAHHELAFIEQKMLENEEDNYSIWQLCDKQFHAAIISACGSRLHRMHHERIFDQYRQYVTVDLKTNGFRGKDVIAEHHAILDLALKRDIKACCKILENHIGYYNKHRSLVAC